MIDMMDYELCRKYPLTTLYHEWKIGKGKFCYFSHEHCKNLKYLLLHKALAKKTDKELKRLSEQLLHDILTESFIGATYGKAVMSNKCMQLIAFRLR
jgi:hypothetical protein